MTDGIGIMIFDFLFNHFDLVRNLQITFSETIPTRQIIINRKEKNLCKKIQIFYLMIYVKESNTE